MLTLTGTTSSKQDALWVKMQGNMRRSNSNKSAKKNSKKFTVTIQTGDAKGADKMFD